MDYINKMSSRLIGTTIAASRYDLLDFVPDTKSDIERSNTIRATSEVITTGRISSALPRNETFTSPISIANFVCVFNLITACGA